MNIRAEKRLTLEIEEDRGIIGKLSFINNLATWDNLKTKIYGICSMQCEYCI